MNTIVPNDDFAEVVRLKNELRLRYDPDKLVGLFKVITKMQEGE